jgi:excisionase family DNA binding protein
VSLPQHSPAPTLSRQPTYGQRPTPRPTVPGPRPAAHAAPSGVRWQPGAGPLGQRPVALRPAAHQVVERPAPRPAVSFLTVAEVAAIMRVSKMTVYRLVHGGELAAVRVGRSFRVPEPAVRAYLADARTDVA